MNRSGLVNIPAETHYGQFVKITSPQSKILKWILIGYTILLWVRGFSVFDSI